MSLLRALSTVGGLTAVSRLLGFLRDLATAALLGAGAEADAFFIALRLPDLMRRLFAEGAFSAAFTPRFAAILTHEGLPAALRFAEEALAALLAVTIAVIALGLAAMPWLVAVLAPGFGDIAQGAAGKAGEMAVDFARLTFPYLLPAALAALCGGALNGLGRLAAFAAAPIIFNFGMLGALAGVWLLGWPAGFALSAGVTVAGGLQLLWMLGAMGRANLVLGLRRPRLTPETRRLFGQLGPGALAVGVGQINLTVDMMLASLWSAGAVSALAYADRLIQLPSGIIGLALGMALLPRLAGLTAAGDQAGAAAELRQGILVALGLGLPAALGLGLASERIISVLFVRGAFTAADGQLTAAVLACAAVGVPAAVLAKVLSAACFARSDTTTPLRAAIAAAVANLLFSIAFMPVWGPPGIALASALAAMVNLAWLWRNDPRRANRQGEWGGGRLAVLTRPVIRIIVAATGMGLAVWGLNQALPAGPLGLAGVVSGGVAVYALLLVATGAAAPPDPLDRIGTKRP